MTLATSFDGEAPGEWLDVFRSFCFKVRVAAADNAGGIRKARQAAKCFIDGNPFLLFRHYNPSLANAFREEIGLESYEAIHYDHLDATIYSHLAPSGLYTTLDEQNIVANQVFTTAETHPNRMLGMMLRAEWMKVLRYESRQCRKMSQCLVCSEADRRCLLEMAPEARAATIPNGVDIDYYAASQGAVLPDPNAPTMIFVGSLDYLPCEIAVEYFLKEIMPDVKQAMPEARFLIVGANPPPKLVRLAQSCPGATVTGRVPDTRPYLRQSQVCVVPLKSGSGTRLKILEAMAAGLPVVSTTIGAEGLEVRHGRDILLADTPEEFFRSVKHLFDNPDLAAKICQNALSLVQKKYSWNAIVQDLLAAYEPVDAAACAAASR